MQPSQSVSLSTSTFIKAALIVLGIWFLWFIRDIVGILIATLLLAALIDPFADWFARRRIPRGLAVLIVYTLLISITSVMLLLIIPVVIEQGTQFLSNLESYYKHIAQSYGQLQQFSEHYGLSESVSGSVQAIESWVGTWSSSLFSTVTGVVGSFTALVIILVLTFYTVVEDEKVRRSFEHLVPPEYQPYVTHILKQIKKKMGDWLRGQMILSLIVGVLVFIALYFLGIKYALLLALLAAILEVIPYVGPILSLIPALIVGFSISPMHGLSVLIVYVAIQQVENHILVPKIMQRVTGLNPLISIVALLIGIKVAGLLGAILSIPLAMLGVLILEDLFSDVT